MIRPNWLNPWLLASAVLITIAVKAPIVEEVRLIAAACVFVCGWIGGQLALASRPQEQEP